MLISFDQLFRKYRIQAEGVLHLGANTGQEMEAYAQHNIPRVIWVEAHPPTFTKLVSNMAKYPQAVCLEACVSDKDDQDVSFHVASNGSQSSSYLELGTHAVEHPTVKYVSHIPMKTIRVDTLLHRHGITLPGDSWFLNADLQGVELQALVGMGSLLKSFQYAYIEVNAKELYKGCALVKEVDTFLASCGFAAMESCMTGSFWGDCFYMKI